MSDADDQDRARASTTPTSDVQQGLAIRIVDGGAPSPAEEAALTMAVRQVIAERDRRRAAPTPLWGIVGRLEARDGLSIRSRATLPRDTAWAPAGDRPE
jgi:hypothetical protein